MRMYYSGEGSRSNPEIILRDKANIMLTFWDSFIREGRPTKRFKAIIRARKKRAKEKASS